MAGITTAMCDSYKRDLMSGLHCHNQSRTHTGTTTNGGFQVTGVSSLTGLAVGAKLSGTGIPAGTVIASIDSANSYTMSKAATAAGTPTITSVGDTFMIALFKVGVAGTYDRTTTNYSDMTGNSDETTGTGYTAGGQALTNVDPSLDSGTAITDFSPDPTWTSASFSTIGCMIYNATRRGPIANQATSVHDFAGTQTVSSGTFTAVMPVPAAATAILRIA